jgi:hypothetical protein
VQGSYPISEQYASTLLVIEDQCSQRPERLVEVLDTNELCHASQVAHECRNDHPKPSSPTARPDPLKTQRRPS